MVGFLVLKMKYYLYNLNINDDFNAGIYRNSVQVFLGGFLKEANKYSDVKLYGSSLSKSSNRLSRVLSLLRSRFFVIPALIDRAKSCKEGGSEHVFIVLGYDFLNIIQLLILRFFRFKVVCYIFDSHKLSVGRSGLKNFLIDQYFKLGFILARWMDAVVCVNSAFPLAYRKNFPRIIKSKVGYSGSIIKISSCNDKVPCRPKCLKVVFGGTLNNDNGANIILELVRKTFPFDIQFIIYGGGVLSNDFEKAERESESVVFAGKVRNSVVLDFIENADLCINLRDPTSENRNLAFPSKLVEYLFHTEYLISNKFPALDDTLQDSFVALCDYSLESLYSNLLSFHKRYYELDRSSTKRFIDKVRSEYCWENVFASLHKDISKFF